ncbi:MAG: hypothetical protein FJ253_05880, partial [Phycisphaerae bacterium]|nr:hypothetical protein [Phycisphaerae bacterium]
WLGEGDAPTVGVVRNDAIADALKRNGLAVRSLERGWWDSLDGIDVLVVDAHSISDRAREEVSKFLRNGGGLLTAGLGWGWLQLNPGKGIQEHPGNQLLRDAGITWCDGTLSAGKDGLFRMAPIPGSLHAKHALDSLERALAATGADEAGEAKNGEAERHRRCEFDPRCAATLTSALESLAPSDPLLTRAAVLVAKAPDRPVPAQGRPIRRKDSLARALLAIELQVDSAAAPDSVTAHPSARAFPGSVDDAAPRVDGSVTIDAAIPGWHSVGLYAPPGGIITVTARGAVPDGVRLRIGAHSDTLWHLDRWERAPEVVRSWPIPASSALTEEHSRAGSDAGTPLRVASAFGGLIYIEVSKRSENSLEFEISGAVEAPRFVLGRTTAEQWQRARQAPAPWGELESGKVIVTVPSGFLRELDDPWELMQFWDRISDAHATLACIPLQPERPHRFVADLQISAGYMHSGYPIMTHLDAAKFMTDLETLRRGSWGLLHELGHNHQESDWTFGGTVEVTCNLFALHAIDTICTPGEGNRGHEGVNSPPSLAKHLAAGAPFDAWKQDPFLALHMYVQLEREFGWQTFKKVFAEYRALPRDERPRSDDEKRDQWMVRFSRACGRNLGPFFDAWGVPTSAAARHSIVGLPEWYPDDFPGTPGN